GIYEVRIDSDFEGVIDGCAASRSGRRTTWINRKIRGLYRDLFQAGYCHTVETWAGGRLVGGLYGVALHGAYFGESMFSTARDAATGAGHRRGPRLGMSGSSPGLRAQKDACSRGSTIPCWSRGCAEL